MRSLFLSLSLSPSPSLLFPLLTSSGASFILPTFFTKSTFPCGFLPTFFLLLSSISLIFALRLLSYFLLQLHEYSSRNFHHCCNLSSHCRYFLSFCPPMADPSKVRLVRCPKCENLLPELPDYSVYQCGGCGAVLRANNQNQGPDVASENLDEEGIAVSEKPRMLESNDASETGVNPNDVFMISAERDPKKDRTSYLKNLLNDSDVNSSKGIVQNGHESKAFENQKGGENADLISRIEPVMEKRNACDVRFSFSKYPDEGPSNIHVDPSRSRELPFQNLDDMIKDTRVQYLESNRAELLRKLDELKEQLTRSCTVIPEPKEKVPPVRRTLSSDTYGGPNNWFPNGPSSSTRASMQLFGHEKNGPSYFTQYPEFPCNDRHDVPQASYPSIHNPNHFPACHLPPSHRYYSGQCMYANNADVFEPFQSKILNQPACGCFHCYGKNHEVLPPLPSSAFCRKRFPVANNHFLYHPDNSSSFGSHFHHNPRSDFHSFNYHEPHHPIRRLNGLNSERGAFLHLPPRKMVVTTGGLRCRTIAGAAPIIACCNCFELLHLPKKVMLLPEDQQKLRCGACSNIIHFSVTDKKIVFPVPVEASGRINRVSTNFSSEDFDNSGYEFHAIGRKPVQPSASRNLSLTNSQETESLPSSSTSISHDENSPNGFNAPKSSQSPPPPGSPLQEHFDYSSNTHAVNRFGKGNRSSRSDKEKVLSSKATLRQNSLNEASLATELEVSFNDYSNNGGSQDSGDASKDDDQPRLNKGGESFLANFIKRSFKDFSKNNQNPGNGKAAVSVNGHPIPARLVKKAEKLAGQIQPGNYWYDSRAGFWGVIGGPCLGIIPPYIEEFNHPMPENCAGGNTGVFVNGRELHKQDLELLATRGLPIAKDRSYIIEISGRVLDEDTGEELDCLGKLAPTVEKVKHGFGMKAPRAAA